MDSPNLIENFYFGFMPGEYRRNHYVPEWYQKRFIAPDAKFAELFYLDLSPETFTDPRGIVHVRNAVHRTGPRNCFYQNDLYTLSFGSTESTEIERLFFGAIDSNGRKSVEYFTNFDHRKPGAYEAFQNLIMYMSTQKLRTPKGLGWLREKVKTKDKQILLYEMMQFRQLFCAIWTESIWQVASASESPTKFIVSDHPITVYNRACGPRWCRRFNDPDIWLNGTHTMFPLSSDSILILTNLSWVRNPYQSELKLRPNPNPFRSAIFNFHEIQTKRQLSEQEVRQINFITKKRAHRFVAAGNEDWLYPENHVSKSDWTRYGHGYLLMPDPRSVKFSGEMIFGFKDGTATGYDEYGRRPWDPEYKQRGKDGSDEWYTFHRFQGEFAHLFGPYRRGRNF